MSRNEFLAEPSNELCPLLVLNAVSLVRLHDQSDGSDEVVSHRLPEGIRPAPASTHAILSRDMDLMISKNGGRPPAWVMAHTKFASFRDII